MRAYIIRRLLLIIPTVFVVSVMVFISIRLVPGDVIDLIVAQHGSGGDIPTTSGIEISPEAIRQALGLDVPFHVQYGRWVRDIFLHGNLGISLWTQSTVIEELVQRIPVTFELGLISVLIAQIIAIPVGIFSAIRQDTIPDYIARTLAIIGLATPNFWLATMVMVYPAIWWGWSPSMQYIPFSRDPLGNIGMLCDDRFHIGKSRPSSCSRGFPLNKDDYC